MQTLTYLLIASCLLLYAAMGIVLMPLGLRALRLQVTYSAAQFDRIYEGWSTLQRRRYSLHFLFDYPFLVSYGLLGYVWAIERLPDAFQHTLLEVLIPLLLPVAAGCDAIENLSHQRLVRESPQQRALDDSVARLSGIAATAKWVLIAVFLALLPSLRAP